MPNIKNFKPRLYQQTILNTCINKHTLVTLPTGMGKTKTAILVAVQRLNSYPTSKILFLTPTKPLASQITNEFKNNTDIENIELFTGSTPPKKRQTLWQTSQVIVSTPQTITNDIINKRIDLSTTSCLIIDEIHRAVKNYDYVWLAKQYNKTSKHPRIIGLTASPGSDLQTIRDICNNASIEEIEVRTEQDPDVKPYIQELKKEFINVELPDNFKKIQNYLKDCFKSKLTKLKEWGFIGSLQDLVNKKQLLILQGTIHGKLARGERDIRLWQGISITAESIKAQHALEMLETQGIKSLHKYQKTIYEQAKKTKTKAVKNLANDLNFKSAYILTQELIEKDIEHPKLIKLKEIIKKEIKEDIKILVFNQYRDSAKEIETKLNQIENVKAKLFVGQQKKDGIGLNQKEQIEILDKFGKGEYNTIISTSIGEEGLDIPAVDLVIFYEPVPSAIRAIQRRGRTARLEKGKVIILITKNTRDEAYHWVAHHKEKRMYKTLKDLKEKLKLETVKQPTLKDFKEEKITIYADSREKGSQILKELTDLNIDIKTQNQITDFIISDIGVERKSIQDFADSIIDGRLLKQLKELKENFKKPLLILEGDEDIFSVRRIHPNAIQGMLATIAISYQIPILKTKNFKETATLLKVIASKEEKPSKEFLLRTERKPLTLKEQQEYIVESLPGVGASLAKSLLKEFKTIKNIINTKELTKVEKIGKKKAEEIKKVLEEEYED